VGRWWTRALWAASREGEGDWQVGPTFGRGELSRGLRGEDLSEGEGSFFGKKFSRRFSWGRKAEPLGWGKACRVGRVIGKHALQAPMRGKNL